MLRRAVDHQHRNAHAEPDLEHAARHDVILLFLVVDHLLDRRAAATATLLGPGDAGKPRVRLLGLPGFGGPHRLRDVVLGDIAAAMKALRVALALGIFVKKCPRFGAKRGFLGSVFEIHAQIPYGALRRSSSEISRSFQ